jgi:hypothetical protein
MFPHRQGRSVKKGVSFDEVCKPRKQLCSPPLNLDTAPVYLSQRFVAGNLSIELGNAAYAARPVRLRRPVEAAGTPTSAEGHDARVAHGRDASDQDFRDV